jgi:selenium metabolism protein YedF
MQMSRENQIDMRGRACPEPVVETRKALANPGVQTLSVLVDNDAAAENVKRMATSMGWAVAIAKSADDNFTVTINKESAGAQTTSCEPGNLPAKVVMLVASSTFGEGAVDLGATLMGSLMKTVKQLSPRPECMIFLNTGIHLTTEGSDVLEHLKELESDGVQILSCGTCLDYFKLKEKLKVGSVSNMYEIGTQLVTADRVVRI